MIVIELDGGIVQGVRFHATDELIATEIRALAYDQSEDAELLVIDATNEEYSSIYWSRDDECLLMPAVDAWIPAGAPLCDADDDREHANCGWCHRRVWDLERAVCDDARTFCSPPCHTRFQKFGDRLTIRRYEGFPT